MRRKGAGTHLPLHPNIWCKVTLKPGTSNQIRDEASLTNPRQNNLEANWGLNPILQKVDASLYPTLDAVYKEFTLALRSIAGHNNRKNAKALYATGKLWEHSTVWNFDESKLWPEPSRSIHETTATGKTTSPLIRVSGMKYGLRGVMESNLCPQAPRQIG